MKVLVLGAGGQIGKCISDLSKIEKHNFILTTKKELDITDHDKVNKYLHSEKPDVIINASAYTAVDMAEVESETANKINNLAVANLAESSKKHDAFLIHISTDYVFDGNSKIPYIETSPTSPQSVYGLTKKLGEKSIELSGCKYLILRTSWIFSEYGKNFLKTMLLLAENQDELEVVNDQIGCPTFAHDVARLIISSIDKLEKYDLDSEIYHFTGIDQCSWYEFALLIFGCYQDIGMKVPKIAPVKTDSYKTKVKRPKFSVLDSSKARAFFGIEPTKMSLAISATIKRVNELKRV